MIETLVGVATFHDYLLVLESLSSIPCPCGGVNDGGGSVADGCGDDGEMSCSSSMGMGKRPDPSPVVSKLGLLTSSSLAFLRKGEVRVSSSTGSLVVFPVD